jgi:L-methionine (R)-S-oxide reductase
MVSTEKAEAILQQLRASEARGRELRRDAMSLLDELPDYNWSGIYALEGDTLVLDEFVGEPTDHTHIPVGRGVCGTAVAERQNQVVEDVNALSNYLSCSVSTKSEIVVLIWRDGEIVGQIDIDGHRVGAFDDSDERLLEEMAEILAERWD